VDEVRKRLWNSQLEQKAYGGIERVKDLNKLSIRERVALKMEIERKEE